MKSLSIIILYFCASTYLSAQVISGHLIQQVGTEIKLQGYDNFHTRTLAKSTTDSSGFFQLTYPPDYRGMAFLETDPNTRLALLIGDGEIRVEGTHLQNPDSTHIIGSLENDRFVQFAIQHRQREAALAGWKYLQPLYEQTELLNDQTRVRAGIDQEIRRLEAEDSVYLAGLDPDSYVAWYLPKRKLIDDMQASAIRYVGRIPGHMADFRSMDFTDPRWRQSGILGDMIEGHYWLLENSGSSLDSVFAEMNRSTDFLIDNLEGDESLLNEVTRFLFRLLERRSLFRSSEYLALKLLTQDACVIEDAFARQLENYRAMKKGMIAPDILFSGEKKIGGVSLQGTVGLSELGLETTLLFFGSSQCPKCREDLEEIARLYEKWQKKGLQVIFLSLDEQLPAFGSFVASFPWLSYCDGKGWESPPVKDYYVFGTPTMFLLDGERRILVRPGSVKQVDAWVESKM